MLYQYCSEHEVPHKQIGKLIVATRSSEVPKLNDLMIRGIENGVDGLRRLEGFEATEMEPELQCVKALFSPVTGIVDSYSLMLSLVVCFCWFVCLSWVKYNNYVSVIKSRKKLLTLEKKSTT